MIEMPKKCCKSLNSETIKMSSRTFAECCGTTRYQALWPLLGSSSLQVRDPEGK